MCFVFIWEQRATCATYSLRWLVCTTEMKRVYSAVRTGSLNKRVWFSVHTQCLSTLCSTHTVPVYTVQYTHSVSLHSAVHTQCLSRLCSTHTVPLYTVQHTHSACLHCAVHTQCLSTLCSTQTVPLHTVLYTHSASLHCAVHTLTTDKYAAITTTTSISTDTIEPLY